MDEKPDPCRSNRALPSLGAALVIAAMLFLAGCATPDNRTAQERATDRATVRKIEDALVADPNVFAAHVSVDVRRGVASLLGTVGDTEDLERVLAICWSVPGVRAVEDGLELVDFVGAGADGDGHTH